MPESSLLTVNIHRRRSVKLEAQASQNSMPSPKLVEPDGPPAEPGAQGGGAGIDPVFIPPEEPGKRASPADSVPVGAGSFH